jgi:hypothetical protein
MGSGLSVDADRRVAGVRDLAGHILSDLVAAGPDCGSNPGSQGTGLLGELVEGPLNDVTDQTPPTCMDGGEVPSSCNHDRHTIGGSDRQSHTTFIGRQGVSVTATASSLSCDDSGGVDLVGPGESQPRMADRLFEGPSSLPLGTLAQEGDLAVIPSKRPGVKAALGQRWRVVSRVHGTDRERGPFYLGPTFRSH